MSTKLRGSKYSPTGHRVPYHLLETAIKWEAIRAALAPALGMPQEGMDAEGLIRHYQQRVIDEADLYG